MYKSTDVEVLGRCTHTQFTRGRETDLKDLVLGVEVQGARRLVKQNDLRVA